MESLDLFDAMEVGSNLFGAVFDGDLELVRNLLENSVQNLNTRDKLGRTLLHYSSCKSQVEIVQQLLEKGANPNLKDKNGNTPLHWCGHVDVLQLLISHGANINDRSRLFRECCCITTHHFVIHAQKTRPDTESLPVHAVYDIYMYIGPLARNCVEATPKEMAIRRGVSNHVIQLYEKYENGDQSEERHSRTLFHEFSDEMGKNNMILLILILIFVSLYVAYTISGLSGQRGQAIIL